MLAKPGNCLQVTRAGCLAVSVDPGLSVLGLGRGKAQLQPLHWNCKQASASCAGSTVVTALQFALFWVADTEVWLAA